MKSRIQRDKYRKQYTNFANGLANQLSGGAQETPFDIFVDEGAPLKMPNVTSYQLGHTFTPSYLAKQ
jgi:hypothetical protein